MPPGARSPGTPSATSVHPRRSRRSSATCRTRCGTRAPAANSAVCYSLGITAVDPVGMGLLFERFLSAERQGSDAGSPRRGREPQAEASGGGGGQKCWPDIDLDLPSGDQREKVIQHVYQRYGSAGAAEAPHGSTDPAPPPPPATRQGPRLPPGGLARTSQLLPPSAVTTHPRPPQ